MLTAKTLAKRLSNNLPGADNAGARRVLVQAALDFESGYYQPTETLPSVVRSRARAIGFTTAGLVVLDVSLADEEPEPCAP